MLEQCPCGCLDTISRGDGKILCVGCGATMNIKSADDPRLVRLQKGIDQQAAQRAENKRLAIKSLTSCLEKGGLDRHSPAIDDIRTSLDQIGNLTNAELVDRACEAWKALGYAECADQEGYMPVNFELSRQLKEVLTAERNLLREELLRRMRGGVAKT